MMMNSMKHFQNSNSFFMQHLILFQDHILMISLSIMSILLYWSVMMILSKKVKMEMMESNQTEIFWTLSPIIILLFISMPSMLILYMMEETFKPTMTIKITGNQWYWTYEYPEMNNKTMNGFMKTSNKNRLLELTNPMIILTKSWTRLLITSNDVIHSWAVPSMGVKMDAIPGRLNMLNISTNRSGTMLGQCSEICGMNHSFMPIKMMSIHKNNM